MSYFEKLSNRYANVAELKIGQKKRKYASNEQFLAYYDLENPEVIFGFWPKLRNFPPSYVQYACIVSQQAGLLSPHRDHGQHKCVVNWYLETNDSVTSFFVQKPSARPWRAIGEPEPKIYSNDEITRVGQFQAHNGDVYLLNVSEIHSVLSPSGGTRAFVTMAWNDRGFQEILPRVTDIFGSGATA